MVIPSPSNSKRLIDVYLETLIKELQNLCHVGVLMRDSSKNEAFMMHAALMWTLSDLPGYGMGSGWNNAGVMRCPICVGDTSAFYLQNGRKGSYFGCHRQFPPPSRIIPTVGTRKHSLRIE
ncbi:UNVERIFIED_CONTAM: hypothetical protein Sradi_5711600 [Sesamum radiatum]|uniref:Uncharacterized protein n=1 Tax=Sesamum radiatum TaxID=300843 RepID=A0AAW2L361_SESRA